MKKLKRKSLNTLEIGISRFEDSRNPLKTVDYKDLNTFISGFLNAPDKKQRRKLAAEFQKRHMELYQFLKDNPELLNAETEISRMVQAAAKGEMPDRENRQLTNLLQMMEESFHDVQ